MIDEDLDEDVEETIQHYARKKREGTNHRSFLWAAIVLIVVLIAIFLFIYR